MLKAISAFEEVFLGRFSETIKAVYAAVSTGGNQGPLDTAAYRDSFPVQVYIGPLEGKYLIHPHPGIHGKNYYVLMPVMRYLDVLHAGYVNNGGIKELFFLFECKPSVTGVSDLFPWYLIDRIFLNPLPFADGLFEGVTQKPALKVDCCRRETLISQMGLICRNTAV